MDWFENIGTGNRRGVKMIQTVQRNKLTRTIYYLYVALFLTYLLAPLVITAILAFNDSQSPSFPWKGFTLKWFFSKTPGSEGMFGEKRMMQAIGTSVKVAFIVTFLALLLGISNAFLFERQSFKGKQFLYILMLVPLVIPGVVLGISILSFTHRLAEIIDNIFWRGAGNFLRPGFWLVVFGQLSFIATLTTLTISSRLKKFDIAQEEAAMDLGTSRMGAVVLVTFRFLIPSILGAAIISFLYSFNNFNTTYFLIGTNPTLPVLLYSRLRFGITPQINAVSVFLMAVTGLLGLTAILSGYSKK